MVSGERTLPFLGEDRKLSFLETAWSRRGRLELFNGFVLPCVWPGREAAAVDIEDMTYTPGKECVVLYALQLADASLDPPRWAVATFAKDDRLGEVFRRDYRHADPGDEASARAVLVPELRCLVEFFPDDWKLPALARALDPARMAAFLGRLERKGRSDPSAPAASATVLRYRPHGRCVLRYVTLPADGSEPIDVIGKVFREKGKAQAEWRVLSALHPEAAALGVSVPRPIAFVEEHQVVLMERLPGSSLKEALRDARNRGRARELARLAAGALASLHALRIEGREPRTFESELEKVRKRVARLPAVAPLLGRAADAALEGLESAAKRLPVADGSFLHGDFKPSQLLLQEERVAVIDLDRVCSGDPAIDVGNFMAQFRKEALYTGQEYLRTLASHFLGEYEAHASVSGVADRARVFETLALVRMAVRRFRRSPHVYGRAGPASLPVRLLEEAAACCADL